jgi:hypothetical protein
MQPRRRIYQGRALGYGIRTRADSSLKEEQQAGRNVRSRRTEMTFDVSIQPYATFRHIFVQNASRRELESCCASSEPCRAGTFAAGRRALWPS